MVAAATEAPGNRRALPDPIAEVFTRTTAAAHRYEHDTGKKFISLAAGTPAPDLLPLDGYRDMLLAELSRLKHEALNYTLPQGRPELRTAWQKLLAQQGVRCSTHSMLITSGGMEALALAAQILLNTGDTVLAEGPGFPGILSFLHFLGARVVQVDIGPAGMEPASLQDAIRRHRPKLVVLMPDHQNPTGAVMPLEHRKEIAALLIRHGVYALEDGCYAQLGFTGPALPPVQSFAPDHVLYAASTSKIIAPALRLGALAAPQPFIDTALAVKSSFNMQASSIQQAVAADYLGSPALTAHLAALQDTYRNRCATMVEELQKQLTHPLSCTWTRPQGGMFLWLSLPQHADPAVLLETALREGVAFVPSACFYSQGATRRSPEAARLNFASSSPADIIEGVRRLVAIVQRRGPCPANG